MTTNGSALRMMLRLFRVCAAAFFAVAIAPTHAAPNGWTQIWNDEFNGSTLDAAKWTPETTSNPANNERQAYIPQQVTVSDGNMVITSENIPLGGKQYRSGRVHSNFAQRLGRWEVRADLPTSRGMWPAIWLLPDTTQYNWPSQGEIDIMENRGTQQNLTSSAFHYGTNPPYAHSYRFGEQTTARMGVPVNYHTGFHTYAVEWDETKVRFFVDDVHHLTIYNADVGGFIGNQTAPMRTMLNTAVGGDFLGSLQPDASTVWPQRFLIDYVRIFEKNDSAIRFQNGSFDKNDGSLAGWSTFGNRVNTNNVSVHNQAMVDGPAALKLFGQANGSTNYSGVSQGISVSPGDEVQVSAHSFIRSLDSIAGTGNSVQMKIEFYNDFGGKHGTSALLNEFVSTIANASSANDVWREHELSAVAPAGAVEARLAFVFVQPAAGGAGAVHIDDVAFKNLNGPSVADADGDGDVDGHDFLSWQLAVGNKDAQGPSDGDYNFDGSTDANDLVAWQDQFGVEEGVSHANQVVPEPSTAILAIATLTSMLRKLVLQPADDLPPPGAL